MATINWNDGRVVTLNAQNGDTAICTNVNSNQLYALIFYATAINDSQATINVYGTNSAQGVPLTVNGSTGGQATPAVCFFSGQDSQTISAAINTTSTNATVNAFIVSAAMPINTAGINNVGMPLNGQSYQSSPYTRLFGVPSSTRYMSTVSSGITSFTFIQMTENSASFVTVNGPAPIPYFWGPTAKTLVTAIGAPSTSWQSTIVGNGFQYVWMNADSPQNSSGATISVQQQ